MTLNEKRIERRKIWEKMKALNDKALAEKRDLTAEEQAQWKVMETDVDRMGQEVEAEESRIRKAKEIEDSFRGSATPTAPILPETSATTTEVPLETRALRKFLADGDRSMSPDERRALQMDKDIYGGYTVLPQQFVADLIKAVDNETFFRGLADVMTLTNAESVGFPSLDNDPADPTWTAELLIGSEDSTMSFGKRELRPHPLAQYIKISKKLIRASAMDVESMVRQRLAYKVAVVQENAFLNGSGVNQPLGVFTVGTDAGITTGQDVSTGNTDTEIKADGLIEAKYHLKPQYWPRASWVFHRDAVKQIRKLKDGEGQYIWRAGITSDQGDTILDVPVKMSEYAPNTFTTGLYVGIIGDFKKYKIADALGMEIQVLTELYAATNQNGYVLRAETDGMPVLEEAFIRVTLA